MSRTFNTISAKPTFGNLRESLNQGEYLNKKKGLLIYCNSKSFCNKITKTDSYAHINLYNNASRYISNFKNGNLYNANNLVAGQYSALNLKNVCVSVPSAPEFSNPSYWSPNEACVPCLNTQLATNNTKINVNSNGDYVESPSGTAIPFYQVNTIDPEGQLFGNSQCGELNFISYMGCKNTIA
jgi:hypothetical protein